MRVQIPLPTRACWEQYLHHERLDMYIRRVPLMAGKQGPHPSG